MHRGYIKFWRKTIDSRIFKDPNLLKVWLWCLIKANHKGQWIKMETGKGCVDIRIEPGQFVFGRDSAAVSLDMKSSSVRNRIEKLKNMKNIGVNSDRQYSIITIINWDVYQPATEKQDSDVDSDVDRQRTGKGQAKDTNNNDKNDKNDKNVFYSPEIEDFVYTAINRISELMGNLAPQKTPALEKSSSETIDKLVRIDGFDLDYIKTVMGYAMNDDFWRKNALSLASLRVKSKSNGLMKFQNIANSYEQSKVKHIPARLSGNVSAAQEFIEKRLRKEANGQ